jgi:hypothetical protein
MGSSAAVAPGNADELAAAPDGGGAAAASDALARGLSRETDGGGAGDRDAPWLGVCAHACQALAAMAARPAGRAALVAAGEARMRALAEGVRAGLGLGGRSPAAAAAAAYFCMAAAGEAALLDTLVESGAVGSLSVSVSLSLARSFAHSRPHSLPPSLPHSLTHSLTHLLCLSLSTYLPLLSPLHPWEVRGGGS